jgi:hypothetical protein
MKKQIIGAQGEVTIIRIDAIPAGVKTKPATERNARGQVIISHSESGNHHVVTGGEVLERTSDVRDGMQVFYAIFGKQESLIQDAPVPHESYDLPAGFYEFRISREFDPFAEQARRVAD